MSKLIMAEMRPDSCEMYAGQDIPVVVLSDHPRFVPGVRFDYGFLQCALRDGYDVVLKNRDKESE
jgi:hypothetical protein